MVPFKTSRGRAQPLGATAWADGVNFALLSRHATAVQLIVYPMESDDAITEITLNPERNRTGNHWHVCVAGLPEWFRYGWRVDGPTGRLHRFNPEVVLLDPAATAISDGKSWGQTSEHHDRKTERRSIFYRRHYDWHDDIPPRTPMEDLIIYEMHVRGFTCHPSACMASPGTFAGIIEKIPYLKELGINAVELLPVHEFDENDCPFTNPLTGKPLRNFWGYNSISFAAPKAAYSSRGDNHDQVGEFRDMVRAFHAAGIEVILDVVFNHTGEGDDRGRTSSFRGIDNCLFYLLNGSGQYYNFSGCGNTLNCNHPVVRNLILTCLRYWVADMHVDGLRFDLASVMGRDRHGNVLVEPPIVEMIAEDGVLADTKLIAEPWDAVGLYQVGHFPFGQRWSEWNGRYRDDVRRFWRGDPGMAGALATRICGSSDLYQHANRPPRHSINFVTCHDGFTLWDLVSYNYKHNEANGENNCDGMNDNLSWNCGVEGPTTNPLILDLRRRQAKNLMTTLMVSQGVPMILAGDEFLRTQDGNNNAWCQDNELSWLDWDLAKKNAEFLRFTREIIALRRRHPALRRFQFFHGRGHAGNMPPDIVWHGVHPYSPDFSATTRTIAFAIDGRFTEREPDRDFYVAMNSWMEPVRFCVPESPSGRPWRMTVDTAQTSPFDIVGLDQGARVAVHEMITLAPHSCVILISEG